MDDKNVVKLEREKLLEDLLSKYQRGYVHVVGRTLYRTASVSDHVVTFSREDIRFLEDQLISKDNHCVLIFQITTSHGQTWKKGMYYILLADLSAMVGKQLVLGDF